MKLDPDLALHAWGRSCWGKLVSVLDISSQAPGRSEDFDATIARAVDPFFHQDPGRSYRSLALWVLTHGQMPSDFRWREPGETRLAALMRHGWIAKAFGEPLNLNLLYGEFRMEFAVWWEEHGIEAPQIAPLLEEDPREPVPILSAAEAAGLLGKTLAATNNLLSRGKLEGWKHQGRWFTNALYVQRYQASCLR